MPSYAVAGASRGLGLEFVIQLLSRKDTVIALVRDPSSATQLQAIDDPKLHILQADVTDAVSVKAAAEETAKITGGSLDVLIHNAVYRDPPRTFHNIVQFPDTPTLLENFNGNWTTNVIGPIITTDAFLPLLRKSPLPYEAGKKIVFISSGLADVGFNRETGYGGHVAYSVSKSALEMVCVKYALALKDEKFVVLGVSPGLVNTATAPPPSSVLPRIAGMKEAFSRAYPSWNGKSMEPKESVEMVLKVVDEAGTEKSGQIVSHFGTKQWL